MALLSHTSLLCCASSLLFAAALSAQPTWPDAIQNLDLAGVARLLSQSGTPAWPELSAAPSPLALLIHFKIKQLEGAKPPDIAAIPGRVQIYADLARRFRAARGYANYVLADTLQTLSILHLARLVKSDSSRTAECAALLQSLDFPLLTPETFKEIYRAKVGPTAQLDSDTPEQMTATMKRLGDVGDGFLPVSMDAIRSAGTGALLTRANPAGFVFRLMTAEILGCGALPDLIEFLRKGGRLADINLGDVRNYRKLIPGDAPPRTCGMVTAGLGVSPVDQLIAAAGDPDSHLLLWALDGPRRPAQSRFRVKEQRIGKAAEFQESFVMGVSPNSSRYHIITKRGSQRVMLTERGESRPYDNIQIVLYNPQGTRLAFIASRGKQWVVVLDGIESKPYDHIPEDELHFSPDGRHMAFLGKRGAQSFVVTDGRESAPLPDVCGLSFSPSQQLAYMLRRNQRWTIVYGQHQPSEYRGVNGQTGITFSPDGKSWAYQATTLEGRSLVILEGAHATAFPTRNMLEKPIFSPDGRRVFFRTQSAQPDTVDVQLLDLDHPSPPRTIHATEIFFSRDLRRHATVDLVEPVPSSYTARSYRVTIDGREYRVNGLGHPRVTFSPRGTRFAIVGDQDLIDGTPIPAGQLTDGFLFSPDDKSCAYAASIRSTAALSRDIITRDGKEVQAFRPGVGRYPMAFSPDSRHLAYVAPHGVMHVALAVDGEEAIPTYDFIPYNSVLVFDAPNQFHTIAVRGDDVLLVEVSWDQ